MHEDANIERQKGVAAAGLLAGQEQLDGMWNQSSDSKIVRSKFLKRASAVLFGATAAVMLPNAPEAMAASALPCYGGAPLCGGGCCANKKCDDHCNAGAIGCHTNQQCWFTCSASNKKIKCCDCLRSLPVDVCICRFNVGTCQ